MVYDASKKGSGSTKKSVTMKQLAKKRALKKVETSGPLELILSSVLGGLFNTAVGWLIPLTPAFFVFLLTFLLPLLVMGLQTYKDEKEPWKTAARDAGIIYLTFGLLVNILLTYVGVRSLKFAVTGL